MLRRSSRSVVDEAARLLASCASCASARPDTLRTNWSCRSAHVLTGASPNAASQNPGALLQEVKTAIIHRQQRGRASCNLNGFRLFSSGGYPPHEVLSMPALSPTMVAGNLVQWRVKEGDEVEAGSIIADIETDKATLGFETQDDGFIAKLIVGSGTSDIAVGVPIAVVVDSVDDVQAFVDYTVSSVATEADGRTAAAPQPQEAATSPTTEVHRNSRIGPAARMALANAGLAHEDVEPTGPHGIVTKSDVLAAAAAGTKPKLAAAPAQQVEEIQTTAVPVVGTPSVPVPGDVATAAPHHHRVRRGEHYTDEPVTTMRRVIAQRLLQSKQSLPAIYVTARARLKALSELRAALKAAGMKASVNDFVIKAVAKALVAVPGACAGWNDAADQIMRFPDIDVSVAVATEGGLITPIVKAADQKSVTEIGSAMKDLAGRARENKLKPEEFMGGSFSISNLGMFGIKEFSAIINPPQACILAVGGPQQECVQLDDHWVMDSFMNVRLSADNRVVDEATAAEFLDSFTFYIENPGLLMA